MQHQNFRRLGLLSSVFIVTCFLSACIDVDLPSSKIQYDGPGHTGVYLRVTINQRADQTIPPNKVLWNVSFSMGQKHSLGESSRTIKVIDQHNYELDFAGKTYDLRKYYKDGLLVSPYALEILSDINTAGYDFWVRFEGEQSLSAHIYVPSLGLEALSSSEPFYDSSTDSLDISWNTEIMESAYLNIFNIDKDFSQFTSGQAVEDFSYCHFFSTNERKDIVFHYLSILGDKPTTPLTINIDNAKPFCRTRSEEKNWTFISLVHKDNVEVNDPQFQGFKDVTVSVTSLAESLTLEPSPL